MGERRYSQPIDRIIATNFGTWAPGAGAVHLGCFGPTADNKILPPGMNARRSQFYGRAGSNPLFRPRGSTGDQAGRERSRRYSPRSCNIIIATVPAFPMTKAIAAPSTPSLNDKGAMIRK